MKKFTTIILAAALVFAVAGQVSASTLETSGEFRARYWYANNFTYLDRKAFDDSMEWGDQRLRLNANWKVTDTVKVFTRADILENVWSTSTPVKDNGEDPSTQISFDQVYGVFDLGSVAVSLGKMDVTWGTGAYAAADNRYRIKLGTKFDKVGVGAAFDTFQETFNSPTKDDDIGFSAWVTLPVADWNFGVLGLMRQNGFTENEDVTVYGGDIFAKGAIGPVKINAEFAYATGEVDFKAKKDVDVEGMLGYAGAFIPVGPVNLGVEFGYAQGDDPDTSDREGVFPQDYQGPFNSFVLFTPFDFSGWQSDYAKDTGLSNVVAVKGSVTFPLDKQWTLYGAVVWAQADQQGARADKDMGIEFDGLVRYAVSENVAIQAGVGYLSAGDYFKSTKLNMDPNNPIVVTVHAITTF